jgi:chemotaxis protein CheY-P-specific phosphatase CheC
MQEISQDVLVQSLTEALETMAFMMVMPPEEDLPVAGELVRVTMRFSGSISGMVQIMAGKEFLASIAANVLGGDVDDEEVQNKGVDAFREVLNTTCGVLLPQLASSAADVFNVTVPEDETFIGEDHWHKFIEDGAVVLDVDGNPLAGRIMIEK